MAAIPVWIDPATGYLYAGAAGQPLVQLSLPSSAAAAPAPAPAPSSQRYTRGAAWSGSGVSIIASVADIVYIEAPVSGTIRSVTMLGANGVGSASAEVWKTAYAGALPTSASKISGGTPPAIASGVKYQDSTLTGWTTAVTAGDILAFKLLTCSVFSWVSINLDIL